MRDKYSKGFSNYFSIGHYKGVNFQKDGPSYRLNFLWFSICFGGFDLEKMIRALLDDIGELEGVIENLKKESSKNIIEYQDKLKQAELVSQKLTQKTERLNKEINSLNDEIDDLNDEITDLNVYRDQNDKLKDKIAELEKTIDDLMHSSSSSSSN